MRISRSAYISKAGIFLEAFQMEISRYSYSIENSVCEKVYYISIFTMRVCLAIHILKIKTIIRGFRCGISTMKGKKLYEKTVYFHSCFELKGKEERLNWKKLFFHYEFWSLLYKKLFKILSWYPIILIKRCICWMRKNWLNV